MAQDPWAEFEEIRPAAAQPRRAPQPVISLPDPDKEADNARADAALGNSTTQTNIAVRGEQRDVAKTAFQQTQDLRRAYEAAPEVKNYRVVVPQLMDALKTPADASGDNALLYAYSKIMDPASVVRESETEGAAAGASAIDQAVTTLKRQFGIEGGGLLAPEIRDGLRRQALARVQQMGRIYRAQRQRYAGDADAYGIDPARVIGPDDFDPYLPQFNEYMKRQQGSAKDPTTADIYRDGTRFGGDGLNPNDGGPFDRERYLRENFGLTGDMEARVSAFWSRNSGNPNLTPQAVAAWYQQNGIPVPDVAQLEQTIATARKLAPGTEWGAIDTSAAEKAYRERLRSDLQKEGFDPTSGGAYGARAIRGAEMGLTDEIEGVGGALGALFNNRGVADGYRLERDKVREAYAQMEAQQGALGTAAELGGGLIGALAIPSGAARGIGALARQGAAQGAVAGFGYGEGASGSALGAAGGAALGAVGGAAFGKAGDMLAARAANRATQPLSDGGEVIAAADRLNDQFNTNIRPIPADVGQQGMRNATGAAAKMPISAALIGRTRDQVTEEAEKAVRAIASLAGTAEGRPEIAGEAAIEAANTYIKRSKTKVDALYTKARTLAGGQRVTMPNAQQQLQSEIVNLGDTPGGATGVSYLEELLGNLDGDWPVDGVKRFRKQVRDKLVKDNLTGSEIEAAALRIVDAADEDITAGLVSAGKPEAAKAYAEASAAAAERYRVIDEAIAPFIGKSKTTQKSGEDVIKAIEAATATKSARLSKFMANIPAEDAANLRATLIERIGRPAKGAETAETTFSLDRFLTNWNGMTDRAKGALFGGELRAALDDLARVASGRKEAGKSVNFSNTGGPVGWAATGGGVVGTITTGSILPVMLSALDGMTGAVLASPKFARWLAKMPSNPKLAEKHVAALSRIAANDNVIAADVAGLQQVLMERLFPQTRAAASPPIAAPRPSSNEEKRRPQGEGQ